MIDSLFAWIDNRFALSRGGRHLLNKIFPDHWSFMIGEIAMYCFVILILTGSYLTFFFNASQRDTVYQGSYRPLQGVHMSEAYRSVVDISFQVRAGLVMRQIHHWAAVVFLAAIVVHLCRIFFTGAFRKPRELNWVIGFVLFITICFGSVPFDPTEWSRTFLGVAYLLLICGGWRVFRRMHEG